MMITNVKLDTIIVYVRMDLRKDVYVLVINANVL